MDQHQGNHAQARHHQQNHLAALPGRRPHTVFSGRQKGHNVRRGFDTEYLEKHAQETY